MKVNAYGTPNGATPLGPIQIDRREPGPLDIVVDIAFCGVCHSDLHTARGEWDGVKYPCVPGHEIIGTIRTVGGEVSRFAVGETVGVGCMVGSCGLCNSCKADLENYCENGWIGTYNGDTADTPGHTQGGYSQVIVVPEHFVLKISHSHDQLNAVAPLLCAGITTYSPLKHWGAGPGKKVGIVGIGGLGHMGIKLAHALGAHVVAFTSTAAKRQDALDLGADEVVVSRNEEEMTAHAGTFDLILDSVSASHDLDAYTSLLHRDGALVLLGVPDTPHPTPSFGALVFGRKTIAGSLIGGVAETQEMLDFCAEHGIVSDIEMIQIQDIENAYNRMQKSDVRYRFVIDNASLATAA
jgi:uncharacterized zinc-type alcohol dehydrogenase-like protein